MEKNALLKIIQDDIQELDLLVSTFINEENISEGYIKLAQKKSQSISDKLLLLNSSSCSSSNTPQKKSEKQIEIVKESENIASEQKTIVSEKVEQKEEVEVNKPIVIPEKTTAPVKASVKSSSDIIEIKTPEPKQEKTVVENKPTVKTNSVIGEVLGKENKSLNEQLASSVSKKDDSFKSAVSDLKMAIGVNDRFLFIRELFNNNTEIYNQVIEQINEMQDISSATQFVKGNFNWDFEDETVKIFMDIVNRRFK